MSTRLSTLVEALQADKGVSQDMQLAQEAKMLLWELYDPNDSLIYPTVSSWDDLLAITIENSAYDSLSKDGVLSILFGLIHRNRVVEGLWWSMFECGVTEMLLAQLLALDTDRY